MEPKKVSKSKNSRRSRYNKSKNVQKQSNDGKLDETLKQFKDENSGGVEEPKTLEKIVRKTNDPAWYMYSPEQVSAVAKLPFSEAFGDKVPLLTKDELIQFNSQETAIRRGIRKAVPGIAAFRTRPTFGANFDITDPLNVGATELYTFVRYTNNGRKNYDAPDLMMHVLAIADLYSYIMWVKKIYGLAFMYSTRNYYLGKALIAACGVDPEDIVRNLANLRYWLNTYINKVSAYVVPESINLFKRRAFLYSDVYTESETNNIKDQVYTFTPDGFFKFGFDSVGAGMLQYVSTKEDGLYTFDELCTLGQSLFENIDQDEDFGLMSGDLLKAFGTNIIKVDPLGEEYIIEPHYDHEVLHQLMNATIDGNMRQSILSQYDEFCYYDDPTGDTQAKWGDMRFKCGNVYQTPNGILVHAIVFPNKTYNGNSINVLWEETRRYMKVLLNTDLPQVEPDHVMEMTRLAFTAMDAPYHWRVPRLDAETTARQLSYISCGSDIVTAVNVFQFDESRNMDIAGSDLSKYPIYEQFVQRVPQVEGLFTQIERVQRKMKFKYIPPIYEVEFIEAPSGGMNEFKIHDIWQNLDNYTLVDQIQLDRIHRVAMYSLAHVPGVSRNIIS